MIISDDEMVIICKKRKINRYERLRKVRGGAQVCYVSELVTLMNKRGKIFLNSVCAQQSLINELLISSQQGQFLYALMFLIFYSLMRSGVTSMKAGRDF